MKITIRLQIAFGPTWVRCEFSVVPDSLEELLVFPCLYPYQVVDSHSGDLKFHFLNYLHVSFTWHAFRLL